MELSDISIDQIAQYQQTALMRLHIWFTGRTHELLLDYLSTLTTRLNNYANDEGLITPIASFGLNEVAAQDWRIFFQKWTGLFEEARYQAAAIPFGQLARQHQHFMGLPELAERLFREKGELPPVFEPQLTEILQAAGDRIYSDGFKLSQRIWRLDQNSLDGLQQILTAGLANQESAWNLAGQLEQHLGPGQDCPRWTSTRLFGLTKSEIAAGDTTGLVSGQPCESKGVAYNALRLGRNEIQIVHHMATDRVFSQAPWVMGENIILSPAHPETDICDEVVADNPYEVGQITLPLHVLCLKPGQLITTKTGDKAIEDIQVGDQVLTHQGRYRTVKKIYRRIYEEDLLKITTKNGRVLWVTPEHPVLVDGIWKAADKLVIGDTLHQMPVQENVA